MAKALKVVAQGHALDASEFDAAQTAHLADALEELAVPVCAEDIRERKFLYANRAFRGLFASGDCGASFAEYERGFVNPPSEHLARLARSRVGDAPAESEFHHTGTQRWYRVQMRISSWGGGRRARVYTVLDATERVAAKRQSANEQERLLMTSRLMSVGELVTTLAHELNQPLGAIGNYLGGAVRRLHAAAGETPADVLGALEKAHLQADHAARIVARMREFVRTREPRRESIRMADIVDNVLKLLELPAQQSGVRIAVELPGDLPCAVADKVMIEQVVLNLTKNALEAMSEVPIERRSLSVSARVDLDGCVELSVADSGPGMSTGAQEQLYSPFFTTKPDGMGMGLNICRSIMEYHQGRLFFCGGPGGGTTFKITLPQAAVEARA